MEKFNTIAPERPQMSQDKIDYLAYAMVTDLVVAGFLGFCVWWDSGSAVVAAISGTVFFTIFGWWVVGNRSGYFTATKINEQNNNAQIRIVEIQERQAAYASAQMQLAYTEPARPQLPGNFVPAIEDATRQVRLAAAGWAQQLFDDDGQRNRLITKNKHQIQITEPAPEVVSYLESLDMVRRDGRNLHWQVDNYPTAGNVVPSIMRGVRLPPQPGGIGGRVRGVNAPSYTSGGTA